MRGTFEEPPTGLIPWFSKTEGNTYATLAASPSPLRGKPTLAQDVALSYQIESFMRTLDVCLAVLICGDNGTCAS